MLKEIISNVSKNVIGNEFNIKISLATIISGGHILIEDLPGTGKTTFAKSITNSLNLDFKRIQFTSDLLPSDILGYTYIKNDNFEINKGPIFTNIVLADELNRASPKTQSAFLESMEEKTVTIDKETFKLPDPFCVIATQNPSDLSGTSLLPESQLDRFSISFSLDNLNKKERLKLLNNEDTTLNQNNSNFNFSKIKNIKEIHITQKVIEYLDNISEHIKTNFNEIHISPRSLKQTLKLAKSLSLINGKDYVTFQEIKEVLPYVLRHRINIVEKNEIFDFINNEILNKVSVPNEE
ncbi:AAA family ATPase [Candidatus Pelagibacter sp.]|uniref:AAA family ATPase n=1 Tax=Candidatus Pelagibacter sp. TaxID=2024849 RepID=UPI003F85AF24